MTERDRVRVRQREGWREVGSRNEHKQLNNFVITIHSNLKIIAKNKYQLLANLFIYCVENNLFYRDIKKQLIKTKKT